MQIFSLGLYKIFYYFILYAFLGWCLEVAYAAYNNHKFVNRGFLFGPVCPMYGAGAVLLILIVGPLQGNLIKTFVIAVLVTSALEYITGYVLEKCFNTTWWDYSTDWMNLHGRICLLFSLLWGFLAVIFVKYIHPLISNSHNIINAKYGVIILNILMLAILVDFIATLISLSKLNSLFGQLRQVYVEFKEKVEDIKGSAAEKTEAIDKLNKELRARYEFIFNKINNDYSRFLKAFPNLTSKKMDSLKQDVKEKISAVLRR